MWVNSRVAAEFFGINNKSVEKAACRAKKAGKKFCSIKSNILLFDYIGGNRGGASGKTLRIDIDERIYPEIVERISKTREGESYDVPYNAASGAKSGKGAGADDEGADELGGRDGANANGDRRASNGAKEAGESEYARDKSKESAGRICDEDARDGLCDKSNKTRNIWIQEEVKRDEQCGNDSNGYVLAISCSNDKLENIDNGNGCAATSTMYGSSTNNSGNSFANLPLIATCGDKKRADALCKRAIVLEWDKAKGKIDESSFIEYLNTSNKYPIKVSSNKLYDWQRKFKMGGLDALVDSRSNNKSLKIEELGLSDKCDELIKSNVGKGRINITNIYKVLNYYYTTSQIGELSFDEFLAKKDECVSYEVVNRYVNNYLKKNKLLKNLILYGEDGVIGRQMPALGVSNWAVRTINEVVEIDASPLDMICNASDICKSIGYEAVNNIFSSKEEFESYVRQWQKRYTIIALIDTYSGVASFHISDSENSLAIARAVAKYIIRYGKPKTIKGDNGKAFKSEYMSSVLGSLEIRYEAVRAYSGWLKPYVERNFRALQHSFSENLAGYIGHNITERQAIEFFYSKKERRLKKGVKTNIAKLKELSEVQELMDLYAENFLNARYLERLNKTCNEAYNEKINDAVAMDAISLSARLSKKELKHVSKKGVSVGGVNFYNAQMFGYERVTIRENIDNINECFVWDEDDKKFIGVANVLDMNEGVSVEEAKAARKLFSKRLRDIKADASEARDKSQEEFKQMVMGLEAKRALKPELKGVNNESKEIEAAQKSSRSLTKNRAFDDELLAVAGSDVKKEKKIKSWQEIVNETN
ncbi:Mu transposase C-terminal domain-containing protein [Campylobacter concisus]|uniref:Rve domain integrase n=1 Tax=Campylobacter concisus TaxID=199 RepID=A0A0M3V2I9_9BACT|nr:Mu transposase C-terminal domain-containing protein [Campylobacter concisus]ALF47792.1 rve domain integrase [Campylobacter concisus]